MPLDGVGEGFAPVRRLLGERELVERAREPGDDERRHDADHHGGLGRKPGVEAAQGIARREHAGELHDPEPAGERGARDRRRGGDEARRGSSRGERQEERERERGGERREVEGAARRSRTPPRRAPRRKGR